MRIPTTFLPEKGLENKIEQLAEKPKAYKKENETTPYREELEALLANLNREWIDDDIVHLKVDTLLGKTGYTQIKNEKFHYEYWTKTADIGESYLLTRYGKKYDPHYTFARIKDSNIEKFCKKFEYKRKLAYPKAFLLTGLALSGSLMICYMCDSYLKGASFLIDFLSYTIPAISTIPVIFSIPRIMKYMRDRTGKGLEKYCIGMVTGDDKKSLEAAFS